MMKMRIFSLFLFFLLGVAGLALTAPADPWKTGQTTPYATGDDGDLQRGVAWPDPRFNDNGDGTVTDNLTGLMWLKDANCMFANYPLFDNDATPGDGMVTWQHALDFVDGINDGTYPDCGVGHDDWRLPNRKELFSLVDFSQYDPALQTGHPFENVQSYFYWSGTFGAYRTVDAWSVDMWDGFVLADFESYYHYVWPVRAGQVGPSVILDHFLCYTARTTKGTPKFEPVPGVSLFDQFEDKVFDVKKPKALCNPASKDGGEIIDPDTHLESYQIKESRGEPKHERQTNILVVNQFGELFVDTIKPDRLLVPTAKSLTEPVDPLDPGAHMVDHYKCYKVKVTKGTPKFPKGIQAFVVDQFGQPKLYNVKKPTRLCTPVDKNGEGIKDPDAHLMCYKVKPAKGEPKHEAITGIFTNNQFGEEQLDTKKEEELCVPSEKFLGP